MKLNIGIALIFFVLTGLCGCVKTDITDFTDKDYEGYHIHKVAIRSMKGDLKSDKQIEQTIVNELASKKIPAESFMSKFTPTRVWSESEVAQELSKGDFDTIMYVNILSSQTTSQIVGYHNSGQASTYGNATSIGNTTIYNGTTTYNGNVTADTRVRRDTAIRVTIYDVKSAKIIWIADCKTVAGGTLFIGDQTQLDSFAAKLVEALKQSGHVPL